MMCAISRKAGGAALAAMLAIGAAQDAAAANFYRLVGIGFLPMEKEPPDLNASFASDVADLYGQSIVVGQSSVSIGDTPSLARGDFHAVRFQEGGPGADYGDLDLGGNTSAANAIDGTELIAGRAETLAGTPPTDGAHAVIWPPPTAGVRSLTSATERCVRRQRSASRESSGSWARAAASRASRRRGVQGAVWSRFRRRAVHSRCSSRM